LDINRNIKTILKLIKYYNPRYVINYAAQSMVGESWINPDDWFYTNSFGLPRLYNEIFKLNKNIRFVHISTPEVYGSLKNKTQENENYNPSTPYAVSRVTADQYLKIMFKEKKLNFVSVRAANVYGETQRLYRIIPKAVGYCIEGKKITLDGGGKSVRSFINIDDVSYATYLVMKKGKSGNIYHITNEEMISIKSLVKKICTLLSKKFDEIVVIGSDRIGKDGSYDMSSRKLRKLGWRPTVRLDDGINRVINWYKKNRKKVKYVDYRYCHKK
jgi:dTDP-glucose 4,6-dehydratase